MIERTLYDDTHGMFREAVRKFFAAELIPNIPRWEAERQMDKSFWRRCGEQGLLCPDMPEAYGGSGQDFRYNAIVLEETSFTGSSSPTFGVHSDIVAHYTLKYASEPMRRHWLPRMVSGEAIGAICMSEPDGGSDLQRIRTTARREGEHYRISGAKTFITNGVVADVAIVAAKTGGSEGSKSLSLFLVETDRPGYTVGRKLDKVGQQSSDVAEIFLQDVMVPANQLLGVENQGFVYMMQELPQERLSIAVTAQAAAQHAFDITLDYVKQRSAFGKTLLEFQNTRFVMADLKAKLQVGWAHLDACIMALVSKKLTTAEAAAAKLWHTELRCEVADACVQLFGGYGYMNEYEISRLWKDARVQRIYGGTSEIMKELISRGL